MKIIDTNKLNRFWTNGVKPVVQEVEKKLNISRVINNLLTTEAGFALDARQGKVLQDQVDEINSNLSDVSGKLFTAASSTPYSGYDVAADSYIHRSAFGQVDLYAKVACIIVQSKWHTIAIIPTGLCPDIHRRIDACIINNDGTYTPIGCYIYNNGNINVFSTLPTGEYNVEVFGSYFASRE